MAVIDAQDAGAAAKGFGGLNILRQVALMVGLAASVAVGVGVALWSQTPNYQLLYANLAQQDASEVLDALQKDKIRYKLDPASGAIMVPAGEVHDARIKLASQGLPKGVGGFGFEIMEKEKGFGTSQFMELARYQRALEGELARSIATLSNVRSARVHLAIPRQSSFLRNRQKPTASVLLDLYAGRELGEEQVAGIVHLTASSIPELEPDRVSVIDSRGRLLNRQSSNKDIGITSEQFRFTSQLENTYSKRIEDILSPIVGVGSVKAQVVAELDFTAVEKTQESFDDKKPAVRSQQTAEEQSSGYRGAVGVPGALSNQPPAIASVPEVTTTTTTAPAAASPGGPATTTTTTDTVATTASAAASDLPKSKSHRATTNYELDKTISHTRQASGVLKRLSVAVVINDKQKVSKKGKVRYTAYTDKEVAKLTALVKDAVGFNEARGDKVNVMNTRFSPVVKPEALPEPDLIDQPWVWDLGKQIGGAVLVLLVAFGVLRPVLQRLAVQGREMVAAGQAELAAGDQFALAAPTGPSQQEVYESGINTAKKMATEDPKRVAQVIKGWVSEDG
ncbi:MAG TPA: flagellar basal body M-ring protein FliF [Acidiferrobacteraceae bacterium]|nr:flagellar basal body M-ring protein FliF [Acidiferrobacteraceae bacterium]